MLHARADGCSVCVHWHVPAAPVAPEQLILRKEGAANTSARGHHIFGRQIVDLVLERTRKLADNCIARRGFLVCNPLGKSSGLWSRVLAPGLYAAGRMCSGLVGLWKMHQAYLSCACTRHVWLECCFLLFVVAIDGCCVIPQRLPLKLCAWTQGTQHHRLLRVLLGRRLPPQHVTSRSPPVNLPPHEQQRMLTRKILSRGSMASCAPGIILWSWYTAKTDMRHWC